MMSFLLCPSSAASRHLLPREKALLARALSLGRGWREAPGEGSHLLLHRVDVHARPDALQSVDDDELSRFEAVAHDAESVDDRAELHGAVLHAAVAGGDIHESFVEIRSDCAILNQQRAINRAAGQTQSNE